MTFVALAALLVCPQQVAADTYALDLSTINATASGESNTCTYNSEGYYELSIPGAWGVCAWDLTLDASAYDYLIVELAEAATSGRVCIYNNGNIWDGSLAPTYLADAGTTIKIKLADCVLENTTTALDPSAITCVSIQATADNTTLKVKSVYFATEDYFSWYNVIDTFSSNDYTTTNSDGTLTIAFTDVYQQAGWDYSQLTSSVAPSGYINLSSYDYINVKFATAPTGAIMFRLYDTNTVEYSFRYESGTESITLDLNNLSPTEMSKDGTTTTEAVDLDLTKIKKIYFWTYGANSFTLSSVTLQNTVTVTDMCYATYCPEHNMDFTDSSIKAYTAKVSGSNLVLNRVYKVPAEAGVLLYYADGAITENINTTLEEVDELTNNDLVGTPTEITSFSGGYVLATVDGVTGFYKANGATVPAGKAYLPTKAVSSSTTGDAAKGLSIVFADDDDGTTGISTVATSEADTAMKTIYNLAGQRLSAPQKGLNIINGKKVIIK